MDPVVKRRSDSHSVEPLWDNRHVQAERAVRRLPRLVEEKRRQVPFEILVFAMPAARRVIVAAWIPGSRRGR
jgi:hypothetical protein